MLSFVQLLDKFCPTSRSCVLFQSTGFWDEPGGSHTEVSCALRKMVLTGMFSALKVAAGPALLSAPRASLRVREPMAKGPETPFLSFLNHRAAGSPSGGREYALLEKSDALRLRAKGQRPTGWWGSLFPQTWRPTLPARKYGIPQRRVPRLRLEPEVPQAALPEGGGASGRARRS